MSNFKENLLVPQAGPFYLPGGKVGCLLVHGFTAMPEEMRYLALDLQQQGYSVLAIRLPGHATHPDDLARIQYRDYLASVEDGLSMLSGSVEQVVIIGQSMGGMLALIAASRSPVAAVVALSTPFPIEKDWTRIGLKKAGKYQFKGPDKDLSLRREENYPAYPYYPTLSLIEVKALSQEMKLALPSVQVPALLMHSKDDPVFPASSMQHIYECLGTADKQQVLLHGMDHSLVCDPKRQEVFSAIRTFLQKVAPTE